MYPSVDFYKIAISRGLAHGFRGPAKHQAVVDGWKLESDENAGVLFWELAADPEASPAIYATPWYDGEEGLVFCAQFPDDNPFVEHSVDFPYTGDFDKDFSAYLSAFRNVLEVFEAEIDAELKERGIRTKKTGKAWDPKRAEVKVSHDEDGSSMEWPEIPTAAVAPVELGKTLSADDVLDLYNKAKAEKNPKKREALMKQVRAASSELENRPRLAADLVNQLLS